MRYRYKAKKGPDQLIEDSIEAVSEADAIEKISQLGFFPISLQPQNAAQSQGRETGPLPVAGKKVRSREVTIFTRQLASLIKAGVPILQSLGILVDQTENRSFAGILRLVQGSIKEGAFFSSALSQYPRLFPPLYVSLVRAGEGSGALPEALQKIADYRSRQEELLTDVKMALAYPILMAVVGIGTIAFMLIFVIPKLTQIVVSAGQELPLPTRFLISVSGALSNPWLWVVVCAVVLFVRRQLSASYARLPLSTFLLRVPLLGNFIIKNEIARFSRTLELLIRNGIPILQGLRIAIPVLSNDAVKIKLEQSCADLEQGGSFGKSLKQAGIFPPFMTNLVTVGEESGRIADALAEVAEAYEKDVERSTKAASSILEPVLILGLGLVVGFIVVAMLLPVFQINVMSQ